MEKLFKRILSYTAIMVLFAVPIYVNRDFVITSYRNNEASIKKLYKKLDVSVVKIYNSGAGSAGSGVYITPNIIVTNAHVTKGAADGVLKVETHQGFTKGFILEERPERDLALIYVETDGVYVSLGNVKDLSIGDHVITIGSSYGLYNTLGKGFISGMNRSLSLLPTMDSLQVSTGVMPGNSGGGVFNTKGDLIGIVYAGNLRADNIGFAIPISHVKELFKHYLKVK